MTERRRFIATAGGVVAAAATAKGSESRAVGKSSETGSGTAGR